MHFLHISLDAKDLENDAMRLFAEIRPSWRRENVQTKVYSEGCLNKLMRFNLADDTALRDAIVVRVFGDLVNAEVLTRDREFAAMQVRINNIPASVQIMAWRRPGGKPLSEPMMLAQKAGCFPTIFAGFDNGVAYQYVPGRTLNATDLRNPAIGRKVTRKLAQLHCVNKDVVPLVDMRGNKTTYEKVYAEKYKDMILNLSNNLPESLEDVELNEILQSCKDPKTGIRTELEWMFSIVEELELRYSVVHYDLHVKNIVLNEETGEVSLLDYEFANVCPVLFDLAQMFNMGTWLKELGIITPDDDPDIFPPEIRSRWLRDYLERQWELEGKDVKKITDDVMERTHVEQEILITMSSLFNLLYALYFAGNLDIEVDAKAVGSFYMSDWYKRKPDLLNQKTRHTELTKICRSNGLL